MISISTKNPFIAFLFLVLYIAGIVIAKGFWSTFFAVTTVLWAYYLVIEKIMIYAGWA